MTNSSHECMSDEEVDRLLASLRCVEVAPPSPGFRSRLRERLFPLVQENRRRAGLPPMSLDEILDWIEEEVPPAQGEPADEPGEAPAGVATPARRVVTLAVLALAVLVGSRWATLGRSDRGSVIALSLVGLVTAGAGCAVLWWRGDEHASTRSLAWEDPTRRLGRCLRFAGAGVITVGLITRAHELPWALSEAGLGAATAALGHYLATRYDWLDPEDSSRPGLHRAAVALVLVSIAVMAVVTAVLYERGADGLAANAIEAGMVISAGCAVAACVLGLIGIGRVHRPGVGGRVREHPRCRLIRLGVRGCGLTCALYAATYLISSLTMPLSPALQVTLLVTAALLLLAVAETHHDPNDYLRLLTWVRGGFGIRKGGRGHGPKVMPMSPEAEDDDAQTA